MVVELSPKRKDICIILSVALETLEEAENYLDIKDRERGRGINEVFGQHIAFEIMNSKQLWVPALSMHKNQSISIQDYKTVGRPLPLRDKLSLVIDLNKLGIIAFSYISTCDTTENQYTAHSSGLRESPD